MDGRHEGETPITVEVGPGRHTVEVTSPGFSPWMDELEVAARQNYELLARLELLPGRLGVASTPSEAELRIDGELVGSTPWQGDLPGGGHLLELRVEGYRVTRHQVDVHHGQISNVLPSLDQFQEDLSKMNLQLQDQILLQLLQRAWKLHPLCCQ